MTNKPCDRCCSLWRSPRRSPAGALPRVLAQPARVDPSVSTAACAGGASARSAAGASTASAACRGSPTPSISARSAAASGRRPTPAAPGSRSSTRSRSPRSARSPSRRRTPNIVYVGTGEADMRSQISYGNGMYKSTDAGKTWTHLGLDNTRQIGAHRRRSARTRTSSSSRRSATPTAPTRTAASTARATAARRGRRCCSRANDIGAIDVTFDPTNPQTIYAVALEHAPSAVEHLSAVVRSGQRPLQVDRRRRDLAAADARPADRGRRPHRHRGRAVQPQRASTRSSTPRTAASSDPTTPARRSRRCRATRASGDAAGTSAKVVVDPKNADLRLRLQHRRLPLARRRQTFGEPFKGSPGGDDYHQLWIAPDDSQSHDSRRRPGRGDQRRRAERASDLELVAEPADGADLPRRRRQRISRTG